MSGVVRGIDRTDVGLAVAAAVAVVGILGVFSASFDLSGLVEDRLEILVGVLGVGLGVVVVKRWIDAEDAGYSPPERERLRPVGVPGDEFDELLRLRELAGSAEAIRFYRAQTREELQAVAIDVLETHRGHTEEEARRRLRNGSWTDDETAADFFRLGSGSGASDELANAIRRPGSSEHPYTRRARRTIETLTRIVEGER